MVSLLLIRRGADIPFAVESVNEFLAYRRNALRPKLEHPILAVCLTRQLDAGWPARQLERNDAGHVLPQGSPASGLDHSGAGLEVRESYSLSGVWTLCRIDGPLMRDARNLESQRELILRMLEEGRSAHALSTVEKGVFPVFDTGESTESAEAEVRALRSRYPDLLGPVWYRADETGRVAAVEPM
ncbi:MAG: hypothetical protein J0H49_18615 [Acidobacteria bacterium]|nr:hypothetical protein [Acidobacteriota bacterium]